MQNKLDTTDFTDYDRFAAVIGLIEETDRLSEINAPGGYDERASYENEHLDALEEFCRENPQFHIATVTTESDDAEAGEYERLFPNWRKFSESKRDALRELVPVFAVCAANCVRTVNRLNYFLADGDKNELLTVTEIDSDQHGYIERFWVCNCDGSRDRPVFSHSPEIKVCSRCQTASPRTEN
jgi:hypothetical protein